MQTIRPNRRVLLNPHPLDAFEREMRVYPRGFPGHCANCARPLAPRVDVEPWSITICEACFHRHYEKSRKGKP